MAAVVHPDRIKDALQTLKGFNRRQPFTNKIADELFYVHKNKLFIMLSENIDVLLSPR